MANTAVNVRRFRKIVMGCNYKLIGYELKALPRSAICLDWLSYL
ncbi:hypothetical protein ACN4EG_24005 [Alkalinema pantanalense CENA528]